MKTARSEGGPFIIMDSAFAPYWGGVMHKDFMDGICDGGSDFESLCNMVNLSNHTRKGIIGLRSKNRQALLIETSFEATVLFNDPTRACIIQAHYSDPKWSAGGLDWSVLDIHSQQASDFAEMPFDGGELVIFDSTCDFNHFKLEIPSISLRKGIIHAVYSIHYPDERTMISVTNLQVR